MNLREFFAEPSGPEELLTRGERMARLVLAIGPDRDPPPCGRPTGAFIERRAFDSQAITALCSDDDSGPTLPPREGVLVVDSVVHAQARVVAAMDRRGPMPAERGRRG